MQNKWIIIFLILVASTGNFFNTSLAFATEPIKLALILARTGAGKLSDASGWGSAQLAVEDINKNGGLLGRQVELIMLDSQSTPIGATRAAQKALEKNVVGVIGAGWSSQSLPIAQIFQDAGIPMITPSSTHPDITKVGNYIFRVCFNDTFQGGALAKFAYNDMHAETAVVFRNISETYSTYLSKSFEDSFRIMGGKVLLHADYKTDTSDFARLLEKVRTLNPGVVLMSGYETDSGIILRQAGSLGIHAHFLGGDGWGRSIKDIAGPAANGALYLSQWHHDYPGAQSQKLIEKFKKRFPSLDYSSIMVPLTYEAVAVMGDAIKRAGSAEGPAIQQALSKTHNFQGITGTITFDKFGDPVTKTATILCFVENETETQYLKAISYP